MPDYQQAKIYKLWCPDNDLVYIGSTVQTLAQRKGKHKQDTNKQSCKSYLLFESGSEVKIELIEKFPCDDKMELLKREGEWIRNTTCVNTQIPGRTRQEYELTPKAKDMKQKVDATYREKHKEELKERHAEYGKEYNKKEEVKDRKHNWYKDNSERLYENSKERRKIKTTCEVCNCEYIACRKSEHVLTKQHLAALGTEDEFVNKRKDYYHQNKDKVVTCECGLELKKWSLSGHKKTQKHINLLAQNCEE